MSEIDFKEIEKAMAELVNKAQGKKREQQLGKVVKKRDEIAKRVDTARGQGTVATKRIIIGNTRLRAAENHNKTSLLTIPPSARNNPINDFRPKSSIGSQNLNELAPPPLPSKAYEEELARNYSQETVGDLSNKYLQEQVQDQTPEPKALEQSEPTDEELNTTLEEIDNPDILGEEIEALEEASEEDTIENAETNQDLSLENDRAIQDTEAPGNDPVVEDLSPPELPSNDLPESDELVTSLKDPSYDYGSVHRIYGQRLPNKFSNHNKSKHFSEESTSKRSQKTLQKGSKSNSKPKRGFLFYFVYFLFVASLLTWAGAAYLYFIY